MYNIAGIKPFCVCAMWQMKPPHFRFIMITLVYKEFLHLDIINTKQKLAPSSPYMKSILGVLQKMYTPAVMALGIPYTLWH